MDKAVFIEELKDLFCDEDKHGRRYSKVWLTEEDFGGLYNSGKYVLHVKAEHQLDECNPEIRYVIKLLTERFGREKMNLIRTVSVYNANEEVHCDSYEIVVFSEENACA